MKTKTQKLTISAVFTALIAVCAQLTIPFAVPFTMQTFAIYLSLICVGAKSTFSSLMAYLALGLVGVPVFSGFRGGLHVFMSSSGGFLIGFLLMIPFFALLEKILRRTTKGIFTALFCANFVCYACAILWYIAVFSVKLNALSELKPFISAIFPLMLTDVAKILLSISVAKRIPMPLR